ncbi:M20 metallopeptidase family protein [Luteibaculum oceani]|uniref:Amidohydrolase n=1 Tax=Luteibaculum oceani TaxID=1294296 RepID=A0A5C6VBH0_9FLAO|nr:M20 family metallopeptidase [Luteibaculum oceani]TXC81786.1 amidohydrolase [Luteibaculum oceani]
MLSTQFFHDKAVELYPFIKSIREHLHANPELSFKEYNTSDFIAERLTELKLKFERNWADTGIVGRIGSGGKHLALRADIDALPITEENDVPYKSCNPGVMHACGHDVHSSCLIGALAILSVIKDLPGQVRFIFQPGEEKNPGGASMLIKEGVLEDPKVDGIIGQHVYPELEQGKVGFRSGMYMASCDEIYIEIEGKGGHGALPHKAVDSVYIASQIVVALQNIVSRKADATIPTVLSFGKFQADGATNVIPSKVYLAGTFRTFNEEWRKEAHELIKRQAEGIAASFGAKANVKIDVGYPFLKNDEDFTHKSQHWARELLGEENVVELGMRMTAEDFSYYSQHVPASFYRLGVRNEDLGIVNSVHHPKFDIDPKALQTGMATMAYLAYRYLSE